MNYRAEELASRRLEHLEEQAAMYGPQTDPSILIEIAELKHKARITQPDGRRAFVTALDFQFVMDVVAAALVRLGAVETLIAKGDNKRVVRQIIHDVWMFTITIIIIVILIMVIYRR